MLQNTLVVFFSFVFLPNISRMATALQLTFGVELEFVVRYKTDDYEQACAGGEGKFWSSSQRMMPFQTYGAVLRAHMITILQEAGFDTNNVLQQVSNYQKWTVDSDSSIKWDKLPQVAGFAYYGIEVKSPAFYYSDWALMQIQRAVMLIRSEFQVFINESCALHVHVGNRTEGFPLQTLKNFCLLVTIFDRQIETLHPLHRLETIYALRPAHQFECMAPEEKARKIDANKTVEDLADCYHLQEWGGLEGYMAYNFLNLTNPPNVRRPTRTIEFRQHEGTLDPIEITKWAQLTSSLIKSAHDAEYYVFGRLVHHHAYDTGYTIIDLLCDLNLHELAGYYGQRGIYAHPMLEGDYDPLIEGKVLGELDSDDDEI